jgi:hypothetical protein
MEAKFMTDFESLSFGVTARALHYIVSINAVLLFFKQIIVLNIASVVYEFYQSPECF